MIRFLYMKKFLLFIIMIYTGGSITTACLLNNDTMENIQKATLGGGCFWCVEAVFEKINGVKNVVSGYSGGDVVNPGYKEVSTGRTGHAEVVEISYDPSVITYEELLDIFFKTHDPTTLNRQGNDVGTQYRSVIFYHNEEQKDMAEQYIQKLEASGTFKDKIVTEVAPLTEFYVAEDYHQDYFANNPDQPYCTFIVEPKVKKVEKLFYDKLK